MRRAILWALVGVGLIEWLALVWYGQFDRPPIAAVLALALVLLLGFGDSLKRRCRSWREEQKPPDLVPDDPAATDLGRRLMGDYPQFVLEAAAEIDGSSSGAIIPVFERAVDRLIIERPPGWREMTGALVAALGGLGDPHCMPLLLRVQKTRGSEEIRNLGDDVVRIKSTATLLRSVGDSSDGLLRASKREGQSDCVTLLRQGPPRYQVQLKLESDSGPEVPPEMHQPQH
jgi:hypothetical protein